MSENAKKESGWKAEHLFSVRVERKNHVARATDASTITNRESGGEGKKGRDKNQGLVVVEDPTVGVDDTPRRWGKKGK